jgi:hypothetical protein
MSLESQKHLMFLQLPIYRKDKGRLITFPFFIMLNKEQLNYICEQWKKVYNESLKTEYSGFYKVLKKGIK